ncbi:MAG TPA: GIY-YIG nuclease family protein, partial [Candidatus Omnitrophota bacterium]|nr:GIY-YIG nuclease family protein [Candidatus Omnitrophota bacterium]
MTDFSEKLKDKVRNLPNCPGVYKFLDAGGKVIYVGKAINLKNRVSSYFRKGRPLDARLSLLVSEIRDLEFTRASS